VQFNATFQNAAGLDFRLAADSPYIGASLDGRDIGCYFGALLPSMNTPSAPTGFRVVGR
jgi:hypothetical protein